MRTSRLELIAGTREIALAEMESRLALASLLDAEVPPNWPPESARDALPFFLALYEAHPAAIGCMAWYAVRVDRASRVLCAGVGFLGPPSEGTVEMGYSVLSEYQGVGIATEMVGGLLRWAWCQPGVERIEAATTSDNPGSQRVLVKNGFEEIGAGSEPDSIRFRHRGPVTLAAN